MELLERTVQRLTGVVTFPEETFSQDSDYDLTAAD
jgi:hypothetical protein